MYSERKVFPLATDYGFGADADHSVRVRADVRLHAAEVLGISLSVEASISDASITA